MAMSPTAESELESDLLSQALSRGDEDAFRELVGSMSEPLFRYSQSILGDSDRATDAVQETFIRIFREKGKLKDVSALRGFCFGITRNICREFIRAGSRRKKYEEEKAEMTPLENSSSPESLLQAKEAWAMLKELPENIREVLNLRYAYGLQGSEIAAALGIPESTVSTRYQAGIKKLQRLLRASFGLPLLPAKQIGAILQKGSLLQNASTPSSFTPDLITRVEESVVSVIRASKFKFVATISAAVLIVILFSGSVAYALLGGGEGSTENANPTAEANLASNVESERPSSNATSVPEPNEGSDAVDTDSSEPKENDPISPTDGEDTPTEPKPEPESTTPNEETPVDNEVENPLENPEPMVQAPEFTSTPITDAVAEKLYVYEIKVSGEPKPVLSTKSLPNWLKLEGSVLRGTPSSIHAGLSQPISLIADNGTSPTATQEFQIQVKVAPRITSTARTDVHVGKEYKYEIKTSGTPAPTLSLTGQPTWLKLEDHVLSGKPARQDQGVSEKITIVASNGVDPDATQEFTIAVKCPPKITSLAIKEVKVGAKYRYEVVCTGFPTPKISFKSLPKWLTSEKNVISGTPRNEDLGKSKSITVTAENGVSPKAKQRFKIEVKDDPTYIESPWTDGEMKEYIKKGVKWTVNWDNLKAGMGNPRMETSVTYQYEVTEVSPKGFTFELRTKMKGDKNLSGPSKQTLTWKEAREKFVESYYPTNPTKPTITSGKFKVGNKSYKCNVYTFTEANNTTVFYFAVGKAFLPISVQTKTQGRIWTSNYVTDISEKKK